MQTRLDAGLTPDIARPIAAAHQQRGRFSTADGTSDGATETWQCPAGERLACRCAPVERGRHRRSAATSAGNTGARTPPCPRHHGGRRLPRGGAEPLGDAREPRGRRRPEAMPQRQPRVEPPFGPRKRWWDQGAFVMRGWAQGRPELSGTVLAYTLRRVLPSVGRPRRLAALGGGGRGLGRAARAEVQEALWSGRWPARKTPRGRCGTQCGWAASQRSVLTPSGAAPDCLQPMLLRRSGFRQQVSAGVRLLQIRSVLPYWAAVHALI